MTDRFCHSRRAGVGAAVLLGICGAVSAAAQAPPAAEERWYVISIGGTAVGSYVERVAPHSSGAIETEAILELTLNRLGRAVRMSSRALYRESADGELLALDSELRLSERAVKTRALVGDGQIRLTTEVEGGPPASERELSFTAPLPGPEGLRRLTAERLRAPGDRIEVRQLVTELGGLFSVARTLDAIEILRIGDREVSARRLRETVEGLPIERLVWVDQEGSVLRQEEPGPFGPMVLEHGSPAGVQAAVARGGDLPAELYARTLARSNVRLPSPRGIERLRLRLALREPRPWPDLASEVQKVVSQSAQDLELELNRPAPPTGATRRYLDLSEVPSELRVFAQPNPIVASDDPEVRELATEIAGSETDAYQVALRLTAWVAREMRFDLGIAFAPASELVRNRRGTCVGYATLLAALARAAGIPSRLAMGYVYYRGIWGGHAWTEMWIGDRWLPFDGAVYTPGIADAARFAFLHDPLTYGPDAAGLLAGSALYGNLELRVLDYEISGASFDAGDAAYAVTEGTYANPGLGFSITAPAGASWKELDGVWPESRFALLERPEATLSLHEFDRLAAPTLAAAATKALAQLGLALKAVPTRAAGRSALRGSAGGQAAVIWEEGSSLLVAVAQAPAPNDWLDQLLAAWCWVRAPIGGPKEPLDSSTPQPAVLPVESATSRSAGSSVK